MARYLTQRLAASVVTALLASVIVFTLVRSVPGDVVAQMLGQTSDPTAERALREFFGLDLPAWRQYLAWLGNVVSGNLGMSWTRGQPVGPLIGGALLVTLQLGFMTLVVATAVGVPLGLVAGIYEGRLLDKAIQSFSLLGLAAPVFWVGLMLLVGVSSLAGWSPPLLYAPPTASVADNLAILSAASPRPALISWRKITDARSPTPAVERPVRRGTRVPVQSATRLPELCRPPGGARAREHFRPNKPEVSPGRTLRRASPAPCRRLPGRRRGSHARACVLPRRLLAGAG